MLIYSMGVSVDGFIADREGGFGWTDPVRSSFAFTSRRLATDKDVSIGGAGLAAAAIELGLVDDLRMFRNPVVHIRLGFKSTAPLRISAGAQWLCDRTE
jgi:dihydrofolate reductase